MYFIDLNIKVCHKQPFKSPLSDKIHKNSSNLCNELIGNCNH